MKKSFLHPVMLAAAALTLTQAPGLAAPKTRVQIQNAGPSDSLRKFLEGLGSNLDDDQRQELDKALQEFQKSLQEKPDESRDSQRRNRAGRQPAQENQTPEAPNRRGRVETVPDDESPSPRSQRPNRRPSGDPTDPLRQQMEDLFPGQDLDQFFGPLLREMRRMQGNAGDAEPGGPMFPGQASQSRNSRHEKAARRTMAEFRPVVNEARKSVVALYGQDDEQLALATIVTPDGYALTKASVLGDSRKLEAEFSDGRAVKAEVVDRLDRYDLALIKLDADNLKPIEWNTADNLPVGTLLAASSTDEDPLAIGVISVPARNLDTSRKGYLGVQMDGDPDGIKVIEVKKGTAADKAGLEAGDVITALDGQPVRSPKELTDYITRKKAEDDVHIGYRRNNEDKVAVATLQSRDDMFRTPTGEAIPESELKRLQRESDPTASMGGRGNRIADGFPVALQNDLIIETNQVGGPAVDIDGKAVALNIARAERTKTYAIPASALTQLLAKVSEGKLTEPKDATDLKRDARKATEELDQLRARLKEAEDRVRSAQEALEKQGR